eukprot:CAMPEP_0202111602 /NCGR_PEP_ID=MMETSP0965-20130614/29620_1 /ASSEMBLY_ACC=CAM_ASM_000507 /TAXON_ID=4773 /ORGANISM="Schizochytrium aggregatum, Strain ATCC28209" /LENGTH=136 /DNA_ID=CAMNT_0048681103 /DNA_START=49 /DNA_END=455 /DNA_ORIENTATION=+
MSKSGAGSDGHGCLRAGARSARGLQGRARVGGGADEVRGYLLALHLARLGELLEVLLRVRADLHHRARGDHTSDLLPFLAVQVEPVQEGLVLLLGPATGVLPGGLLLGLRGDAALAHAGGAALAARESSSSSSSSP